MSGIVGLVHLDGEPVDRGRLEQLTSFLTYCGPDAQRTWLDGSVGFGHTLLQTTWEATQEQQPFSIDSQAWIVADARIDARDELLQQLGIDALPTIPLKHGATVLTDVELILRAYLKWGETCVHYLLGDFVFAIWDSHRQQLFCARDPLGIKRFYYSRLGSNSFIFSNVLDCIGQHPQVSAALSEAAIGDFLLFNVNYNQETTTFRDIQRLPPGHTLTYSQDSLQLASYWTLPLPEQLIRYKCSQDYVDHFDELMQKAVSDRLRQTKIAILFSGGLDSTTIAATALNWAKANNRALDLKAFTAFYDALIPDQEQYYAGIAAQHLDISIHYLRADNYQLFEGWDNTTFRCVEPSAAEPLLWLEVDHMQKIAQHSRVVLSGNVGDEVFVTSTIRQLLNCMSPLELVRDIGQSLWEHRLIPPLGTGALNYFRFGGRQEIDLPSLPVWINADFAVRHQLTERWQQVKRSEELVVSSPCSPAHQRLKRWIGNFGDFESAVPGFAANQVELRYPFTDLRVVNYLLALPPFPWRIKKQLLRRAMASKLPIEVLQRNKTPLVEDPVVKRWQKSPEAGQDWLKQSELSYYIDIDAYQQQSSPDRPIFDVWERLRVISLGYWLERRSGPAIKRPS